MADSLESRPDLTALSAKATPGPWKYKFHQIINGAVCMGWLKEPTNTKAGVSIGSERLDEDGEFVTALVNAYRAGELVLRGVGSESKPHDPVPALMNALEHALEMDGRDETCPECADARRLLDQLRAARTETKDKA